jgi:hypothetical protein
MSIEDTSRRDPLLHLIGMGAPGYIEGMEAQGQRELVASARMPISAPWEDLIALGFVPGDNADDLFRDCSLPPGWSRQPTDHSMWSKIVDSEGTDRVMVFYKAAFYDRKAHAHIVRPDDSDGG